MRKRARKKRPFVDDAGAQPFSLADALAIVGSALEPAGAKTSQVHLLIRTGALVPRWRAPHKGLDHGFDDDNLVALAIAATLINLRFVGKHLTQFFRVNMLNVFDSLKNEPDAEYLILVPSSEGALMGLPMVSAADLEKTVGLFDQGCTVLNIRTIVRRVRIAIEDFRRTASTVAPIERHDTSSTPAALAAKAKD